ncbi:MAG: hypothetical protein LBQ54_14815 [Planctomycetaceae bacterium]|nr:hypothetical protein [Planctomycetaceae bacterium]
MPFHRTSQVVGGVFPSIDSSDQRERVRGSRDGSPIQDATPLLWLPGLPRPGSNIRDISDEMGTWLEDHLQGRKDTQVCPSL